MAAIQTVVTLLVLAWQAASFPGSDIGAALKFTATFWLTLSLGAFTLLCAAVVWGEVAGWLRTFWGSARAVTPTRSSYAIVAMAASVLADLALVPLGVVLTLAGHPSS